MNNDDFKKEIYDGESILDIYNKYSELNGGVKIKELNYDFELTNKVMSKIFPGETWMICAEYDNKPFCDGGGWGSTNPYPFVTSDGKTTEDLYLDVNVCEDFLINEGFVDKFGNGELYVSKDFKGDAFDLIEQSKMVYCQDERSRFYDKGLYPNECDYKQVFINHINT